MPGPGYILDPAFESGSDALGSLPLCDVRLQRDARFPWLILIPRVASARELEDVAPAGRAMLMDEILLAGQAVRAISRALGRPIIKLNVGALGNITRQLHVHVVGRRADDEAWPGPVWGVAGAVEYRASDLQAAMAAVAEILAPTGTIVWPGAGGF